MSTFQYNEIPTDQPPPYEKVSGAPKYPSEPTSQIPAIYGVGEWVYCNKDRNEKGELTGRQRYIAEARYHPPSTPGEYDRDDKWTYLLRDGSGEKAQDVLWANEEDLFDENPGGPPDLIDMSP